MAKTERRCCIRAVCAWKEVVLEVAEERRREEEEEREEARMLSIASRAQLHAKCRGLQGALERSRDTPFKDAAAMQLKSNQINSPCKDAAALQSSQVKSNLFR